MIAWAAVAAITPKIPTGAREDSAEADVIIANHSLYLQDLASGQALLPAHDVVIFDEAHNFKRYAMNAFTDRVGKFASTKLLAKISRRILPIPESLSAAVAQNEATILHFLFRSAADSKRTVSRLSPDPGSARRLRRRPRPWKKSGCGWNRWIFSNCRFSNRMRKTPAARAKTCAPFSAKSC